jgi:hypothetical protein
VEPWEDAERNLFKLTEGAWGGELPAPSVLQEQRRASLRLVSSSVFSSSFCRIHSLQLLLSDATEFVNGS